MININKDEIITLDDNKDYYVAEKILYNDKTYYFAVGVDENDDADFEDIAYFEEVIENEDVYIEDVNDENIIKEILKEVALKNPVEETPELLQLIEKGSF